MSESCRICFEGGQLIAPCKCRGSQQYVHSRCLEKWRRVVLANLIQAPESFSYKDLHNCKVCKTPFTKKPWQGPWKVFFVLAPLVMVFKHYAFVSVLASFCCLSFLGFLFLPFTLNLIFLCTFASFVCYCKGIRPRLYLVGETIRMGLIRVGSPVSGIRKGVVLKASRSITSGVFQGSRVLITAYSPQEGAVGFIINKRVSTSQGNLVFCGGPIEKESLHVLHDNPEVEGCSQIKPGLYLGGVLSPLPQGTKTMWILGYSGWNSYQLDGELRAGLWAFDDEPVDTILS